MYVALVAITLIETPYRVLASVRVAEVLVVLLLAYAAYWRATRADFHRLAHAFLVLVALSVVIGVRFPQPSFPLQEGRFTWLRVHPVTAGVFVGIGTVIVVAYLLWLRVDRPGPRWPWWSYAGLAVVITGALLATQTRGSVLAAAAACLLLLATRWRGSRRRDLIAVGALVVAAVGLAASEPVLTYLARGENAAQLASLNSRTALWDLALQAVQKHPLLGWGVGASRGIFLEEIGLGGGHNAFVNVAVDLGIIGLVVWMALVVVLWRTVYRLPRQGYDGIAVDRNIVRALIIMLVINGTTFEGMGALANVASTWLFLLVGWSAVLVRTVAEQRVRDGHDPGRHVAIGVDLSPSSRVGGRPEARRPASG